MHNFIIPIFEIKAIANNLKQTIFKTFTVGVYTVVFSLLMDKLSLVSEFQERFPILSHSEIKIGKLACIMHGAMFRKHTFN